MIIDVKQEYTLFFLIEISNFVKILNKMELNLLKRLFYLFKIILGMVIKGNGKFLFPSRTQKKIHCLSLCWYRNIHTKRFRLYKPRTIRSNK